MLIDKRLSLLKVRAFFVTFPLFYFDIKSRKNDNLLSLKTGFQFSNKILISYKNLFFRLFKAFFKYF